MVTSAEMISHGNNPRNWSSQSFKIYCNIPNRPLLWYLVGHLILHEGDLFLDVKFVFLFTQINSLRLSCDCCTLVVPGYVPDCWSCVHMLHTQLHNIGSITMPARKSIGIHHSRRGQKWLNILTFTSAILCCKCVRNKVFPLEFLYWATYLCCVYENSNGKEHFPKHSGIPSGHHY